MFSSLKTETLHHAYVIEGDKNIVLPLLLETLESLGFSTSQNSNIFIGEYTSLLIDDARELRARHTERSDNGGKKFFILSADFIQHEAQNALLKTFEEPTPDTHFFLVMPSVHSLAETLRSRVFFLGSVLVDHSLPEAQVFVNLSISERIKHIDAFIKSHEKDENSGAIRMHAIQLLSGVEQELYVVYKNSLSEKNTALLFQDLRSARHYLSIAGASVKMILEHIAMVIPEQIGKHIKK